MKSKCYVRTFCYEVDGEDAQLEYHSTCNGVPVQELSEEFAIRQGASEFAGKDWKLVEVKETMHQAEVGDPVPKRKGKFFKKGK